MCIMGKERKEITDWKCRNCYYGTNLLFRVYCTTFEMFLRKNANCCIAWMRKLSARERRECLTK